MAITVNNVQSSTSKTLSYTPSSVSDAVLVVCPVSEDLSSNEPFTDVDFGGTSLTQGATGSASGSGHNNRSAVYYLTNPGTSTLTITVTGGESGRTGFVALTLGGVNQSTPVDVSDSTSVGTSGSAPYSVSTSATTANDNSLVVSCLSGSLGVGGTLGLSGGTIQADTPVGGTVDMGCGTSTESPAGTYTHTWSIPGDFGSNQRFSACSVAFNEATGAPTDNLLADDLSSNSEVSSPAIGQTHALTSNGISSSSELSLPTLSEIGTDVLLADDLNSSSEVSSPAVGQAHVLNADDLQSASELSQPSLSTGGTDNLLADDLSSASELSAPAIGQVHNLTANDLSSASELSSPTVGQTHVLLGDDLLSSAELSQPALDRQIVPTPIFRTLTIDAESRVLAVESETRTRTIDAENRTLTL